MFDISLARVCVPLSRVGNKAEIINCQENWAMDYLENSVGTSIEDSKSYRLLTLKVCLGSAESDIYSVTWI